MEVEGLRPDMAAEVQCVVDMVQAVHPCRRHEAAEAYQHLVEEDHHNGEEAVPAASCVVAADLVAVACVEAAVLVLAAAE